MARKIRVLVVDDSAVFRRLLTDLLSRDPALEVVGTAADGYIAQRKVIALRPDVVTLDVVMPRVDGLTLLDHLMRVGPLPVVMISGITAEACDVTLQALERGAVDFICKPQGDITTWLATAAGEIAETVKDAANARLRPLPLPARARPATRGASSVGAAPAIVAIGASTGGTEAIAELLMELPADAPGMVIVQHMPREFTRRFAERCNVQTAVRVKEAEAGDEIVPGLALIAPGGLHLRVRRSGRRYEVALDEQPPVNRHRPSVDVLFETVAQAAGPRAVGVLLTGMGSDGARGLLAMRRAGARTIAQDEKSCVVFGMPREAIGLGAAEVVLPLGRIARGLLELTVGSDPNNARTGRSLHALDT
jgi:two-component system, chemotaxis family, protein-glutamate methylesterase/glutaminase